MNRLEVMERVLECQACPLHTKGSGPVPFHGPTPAYLAVVGEAPGKQEDEAGQPFIGPAGKLLREALVDANIDPEQVFFANAASCFPDGTPKATEVHACAPNLAAQLALAKPAWVCLLGNVALSTIRPDLKISRARGHVLLPAESRWKYYVTFHPAYAMRNAKGEQIMRDDLHVLAHIMDSDCGTEDVGWVDMVDNACVGCGLEPDEMGEHDLALRSDDMGATYCEDCFTSRSPQGKAAVKAEGKREREQVKSGLLFS